MPHEGGAEVKGGDGSTKPPRERQSKLESQSYHRTEGCRILEVTLLGLVDEAEESRTAMKLYGSVY